MPKVAVDLAGQMFGRLTVIRRVSHGNSQQHKNKYWLCRCSCGAETIVSYSNLKYGTSRSCGCARAEANRLRKGVRIAQRNTDRTTVLVNRVIHDYKRHAREMGREWKLTEEDVRFLLLADCHYCGGGPSTSMLYGRTDEKEVFMYNGIDRVDNSMGYTTDNVVTCCKACNLAKRGMSVGEFLAWVSRVYSHSVIVASATITD